MTSFLWVAMGSALGGMLRFGVARWTASLDTALPWTTIAINILGSFLIGYFGALTLPGSRHAASDNLRLFVMIGVCGGFTTFSSFSLETFDLLRAGAPGRALLNAGLSVLLCVGAVALGYRLGHPAGQGPTAVARTAEEELSS